MNQIRSSCQKGKIEFETESRHLFLVSFFISLLLLFLHHRIILLARPHIRTYAVFRIPLTRARDDMNKTTFFHFCLFYKILKKKKIRQLLLYIPKFGSEFLGIYVRKIRMYVRILLFHK